MHPQDRPRLARDRPAIVRDAGAVRGADLHQPRTRLGEDVGDPEPVADLDQLTAADQHLAAARRRGEAQQHGRRVVVHGQPRLRARQARQQDRRGGRDASRDLPPPGRTRASSSPRPPRPPARSQFPRAARGPGWCGRSHRSRSAPGAGWAAVPAAPPPPPAGRPDRGPPPPHVLPRAPPRSAATTACLPCSSTSASPAPVRRRASTEGRSRSGLAVMPSIVGCVRGDETSPAVLDAGRSPPAKAPARGFAAARGARDPAGRLCRGRRRRRLAGAAADRSIGRRDPPERAHRRRAADRRERHRRRDVAAARGRCLHARASRCARRRRHRRRCRLRPRAVEPPPARAPADRRASRS